MTILMVMRAVILALTLLLAACGPRLVTADVTRFHAMPPPTGRSFTILPQGGQRGSLEFQQYADLVAGGLASYGYRPLAADAAPADLIVLMRYGIGGPKTYVWSTPRYNAWGSLGYGRFGHGYGGGLGLGFPLGGYSSWDRDYHRYTSYDRWLSVDVFDGPTYRSGARHKVFEGRAVSDGTGTSMPAVMPYLVRALFDGFPGASGQTVKVQVPVGQ